MSTTSKRRKLLRLLLAAAVLLSIPLVSRPWFLHWGATEEEIQRQWPGDELTPTLDGDATRAITIHASADEVWPWIVQIGQDRGGFYSYTWLENLVGCKMRNADRIVPEFQTRQAGDTVWMTPRERYGGRGRMVVADYAPERAMVLVNPQDAEATAQIGRAPNGTWSFLLEPAGEHDTRLIMRSRAGGKPGILGKLWSWFIFDPAHFIMERKMMFGIKHRAERAAAQAGSPTAQATTR
jgi:hypothetical protein